MERQGQLDGAKIGGQMAPALGDRLDDDVAAVRRELRHLWVAQSVKIPRRVNSIKKGQRSPHACVSSHFRTAARKSSAFVPVPTDGASAGAGVARHGPPTG